MTVCPACGYDLRMANGPFADEALLERRYRIDGEVGRGGMGVVYKGTDLTLSRPVAIKAVRQADADPQTLSRFIREARALAAVEHPALVPVYAVGSQDGAYYLVMKFIEGNTLKSLLKRRGSLTVKETRKIIDTVCDALGALHRGKLIHRDIKPGNIMVQPDGRVVVMDLGIVKSVDDNTNTTALALGTPKYMAPELLTGHKVDGRADLYSLGVVAFEALTGRVPFDGPTPMAILFKQAHEEPPSLEAEMPQIPKSLSRAVDRALSKDPEARCRTAMQFADEANAPEPEPEPEKSKVGLWLALLVLVGALGAGGWWWSQQPDGPGPEGGQVNNGGASTTGSSDLPTGQNPPGDADSKQNMVPTGSDAMVMDVISVTEADAGAQVGAQRDAAVEPPEADAQPKAKINRPEPAPRVTITVNSTPNGAEVFEGSRSLGRTPFTLKRRKSSKTLTWKVKRRGYTDRTVKVKLSESQVLKVKLKEMFELLP